MPRDAGAGGKAGDHAGDISRKHPREAEDDAFAGGRGRGKAGLAGNACHRRAKPEGPAAFPSHCEVGACASPAVACRSQDSKAIPAAGRGDCAAPRPGHAKAAADRSRCFRKTAIQGARARHCAARLRRPMPDDRPSAPLRCERLNGALPPWPRAAGISGGAPCEASVSKRGARGRS